MANKFHTCSLRSIFGQVHAPAENDCILFASCGKVLLRKTLVRAIRRV